MEQRGTTGNKMMHWQAQMWHLNHIYLLLIFVFDLGWEHILALTSKCLNCSRPAHITGESTVVRPKAWSKANAEAACESVLVCSTVGNWGCSTICIWFRIFISPVCPSQIRSWISTKGVYKLRKLLIRRKGVCHFHKTLVNSCCINLRLILRGTRCLKGCRFGGYYGLPCGYVKLPGVSWVFQRCFKEYLDGLSFASSICTFT